jgi:hypothetical protein
MLRGEGDAWLDHPPQVPGYDYASDMVRRETQLRVEAGRLGAKYGLQKVGQIRRALSGVDNEAEQRTAERLGVEVVDVCLAAIALWDHTLTEEREARLEATGGLSLSPAQRQAARGHTTRVLQRELRDFLVHLGVIDAPVPVDLSAVDPSDIDVADAE